MKAASVLLPLGFLLAWAASSAAPAHADELATFYDRECHVLLETMRSANTLADRCEKQVEHAADHPGATEGRCGKLSEFHREAVMPALSGFQPVHDAWARELERGDAGARLANSERFHAFETCVGHTLDAMKIYGVKRARLLPQMAPGGAAQDDPYAAALARSASTWPRPVSPAPEREPR